MRSSCQYVSKSIERPSGKLDAALWELPASFPEGWTEPCDGCAARVYHTAKVMVLWACDARFRILLVDISRLRRKISNNHNKLLESYDRT